MAESGNGTPHRGRIAITEIGVDCSFFTQDPNDPPARDEITSALVDVLQQWLRKSPVRVRETLPIIENGRMIALFVWWDRINVVLPP